MTYTTMWAYPWDLLDDGAADVSRRLREEIGLDAVSIATSYHSVEQVRPHTRGQRMFVTFDGAVYYQPNGDLWKDKLIKPNISLMVAMRDPLEIICDAAERVGLKVESWTVCLHNSYLGKKHPYAVERNAFGDRYIPHLCPSHPDVRTYVTTLIQDLTRYPLYAIELESLSFGGYGHFHGHEKVGLNLGEVGNFLMSLCFCDSCVRRAEEANVDAIALAARVRGILSELFDAGEPLEMSVSYLLNQEESLAEYTKVRTETVTSLLRDVREASDDKFLVSMAIGDTRIAGFDGRAHAEIADALELLCYTSQPSVLESMVRGAGEFGCAPDDLIAGLSVFPPHTPTSDVLDANVRKALELGVRGFSFYNYGIMPERNLDWVRSAVETIRKTA